MEYGRKKYTHKLSIRAKFARKLLFTFLPFQEINLYIALSSFYILGLNIFTLTPSLQTCDELMSHLLFNLIKLKFPTEQANSQHRHRLN